MDGKPSDNERMVIKGKPVDIHFGIENLLKECDYICNVLPKTSETDNILGHDKLRLCKGILSQGTWLIYICMYLIVQMLSMFFLFSGNTKGTVLINVGRSDIIDEADLLAALNNNWIKQAKIGVFDPEPLSATHPFYNHPHIVLNCIAPVARPLDVANCFKMNYDRFIARQSLLNTINYVSPFTAIR